MNQLLRLQAQNQGSSTYRYPSDPISAIKTPCYLYSMRYFVRLSIPAKNIRYQISSIRHQALDIRYQVAGIQKHETNFSKGTQAQQLMIHQKTNYWQLAACCLLILSGTQYHCWGWVLCICICIGGQLSTFNFHKKGVCVYKSPSIMANKVSIPDIR